MGERNRQGIYDESAAQWWSDDIRWVRTLKRMVDGRLPYFERFVDWRDKDVLDVGCAGGFMSEAIAKRGGRVTGIDPAEKAIEAAREHAVAEGLDIRYDTGFGESLPYEDDAFDIVVCVDVLEHVSDRPKVLAEIARVIRPGGTFCLDTINRNPLARLAAITVAEDVLRLLPKGTHDPDMFIRPDELAAELRKAGFDVGDFVGLGPRGINARGDLKFGRVPLTAIIYMGTARRHEDGERPADGSR